MEASRGALRGQENAATESTNPRSFCALPAEMKVNIFTFIRTRTEQREVCLVSREWRALMAPMLWDLFSSSLELTPEKKLSVLLNPQNGVLSHVKELRLRNSAIPKDWQRTIETTLKFLIGALPRGSLRCFSSGYKVPAAVLIHLLQLHPNLGSLQTQWEAPDPSDTVGLASSPWIAPSLSKIRQLDLYVDLARSPMIADCAFLVKSVRALDSLFLFCTTKTHNRSLGEASDLIFQNSRPNKDGANNFLQPVYLGICNFDLAVSAISLFEHVSLATLSRLNLLHVNNASEFLEALATRYSVTPGKLAHLTIVLGPLEDVAIDAALQAIEHLLRSINPLHRLDLDTGSDRFIDITCLARHGQTLRGLSLSCEPTGNVRLKLAYQDFATILATCNGLEQLAFNFRPISLGPVDRMALDFALGGDLHSAQTELEAVLELVSQLSKLHTLRFFSCPDLDYPEGSLSPANFTGATQIAMQHVAAQMMAYLVKHGSKLKVISFSPPTPGRAKEASKDGNGHWWPHYYYTRGRNIDVRGMEHVTALPLVHPLLEMPQCTILKSLTG